MNWLAQSAQDQPMEAVIGKMYEQILASKGESDC